MKKFSVVLIAALLFVGSFAGTALAAIEVEGDAYIGVYDKYMWRGFDLSGGVGVVQGGVDLSAGNFTLGYWTNMQAKDDKGEGLESGEATETDIVIDYSFDLNDLVSVSVGNIFYNLEGLDDTNEAYLSVALGTILEPSVTLYYDWDEAEEDALFYTASVGHSLDLAEGLSASLGALVSYNQHSDYSVGDYAGWHNYELSASIDYAVSDQLSVTPSFVYSTPMSSAAKDAIDSETLGGLSVTLTF